MKIRDNYAFTREKIFMTSDGKTTTRQYAMMNLETGHCIVLTHTHGSAPTMSEFDNALRFHREYESKASQRFVKAKVRRVEHGFKEQLKMFEEHWTRCEKAIGHKLKLGEVEYIRDYWKAFYDSPEEYEFVSGVIEIALANTLI